jgi:hypothetical protein
VKNIQILKQQSPTAMSLAQDEDQKSPYTITVIASQQDHKSNSEALKIQLNIKKGLAD